MSRHRDYEKTKADLLKKQPDHFIQGLHFAFKLPSMIWLLVSYEIDLIIIRVRQALSR